MLCQESHARSGEQQLLNHTVYVWRICSLKQASDFGTWGMELYGMLRGTQTDTRISQAVLARDD